MTTSTYVHRWNSNDVDCIPVVSFAVGQDRDPNMNCVSLAWKRALYNITLFAKTQLSTDRRVWDVYEVECVSFFIGLTAGP